MCLYNSLHLACSLVMLLIRTRIAVFRDYPVTFNTEKHTKLSSYIHTLHLSYFEPETSDNNNKG